MGAYTELIVSGKGSQLSSHAILTRTLDKPWPHTRLSQPHSILDEHTVLQFIYVVLVFKVGMWENRAKVLCLGTMEFLSDCQLFEN